MKILGQVLIIVSLNLLFRRKLIRLPINITSEYWITETLFSPNFVVPVIIGFDLQCELHAYSLVCYLLSYILCIISYFPSKYICVSKEYSCVNEYIKP